MYVPTVPNCGSPPAALLRESYRDGDKVKNRTIASLSKWPAEKVEALRAVLRGVQNAGIRWGGKVFAQLGCAACHKADWRTPAGIIHPYADLLLHGLADGRPDFAAGPAEWRTAPLWRLGSAQAVYLHDGRARSVTEAILWHGGEAQAARDGFVHLTGADRSALLAFLDSL